jgi:hypothetical protein
LSREVYAIYLLITLLAVLVNETEPTDRMVQLYLLALTAIVAAHVW